jgi:uncharacterized membrane protein YccC
MAQAIRRHRQLQAEGTILGRLVVVADGARDAGPPLLYAVRLWVSVCLALFVAFWLQLDNPFWAGGSAAIVCQPRLGGSLRKGWFRIIGTVVGATTVVVLTACFPQDRIAFLGLLALWAGFCAFAATALRNFASYAAALSGYTVAIIAAENLGATGGASPDVFLLAVTRASEICIGIVCAGIVLAGTDLGGARRRLAASMADLAVEVSSGFTRMLALAAPQLSDAQAQERELIRRVIALDPMIDQALGESSDVRHHSPTMQAAVHGLFTALEGWRGVATHLRLLPDDINRQEAEISLRSIPAELRSASELGAQARWMADPIALRRVFVEAVRTLLGLPASTPSLRLLADETAKVMAGMVHVLDALALLLDATHGSQLGHRGFQLRVPDWLPALINAARAFVAIATVELLWVATAWPDGASVIEFSTILVLLLSPRGDLAYGGAIAFALGAAVVIVCAATMKFALLPALQTFPALCLALGLFLIPIGFAMAWSRRPAAVAVFTSMVTFFVPLLVPTNPMSYDTAQFWNSAFAILVGFGIAPVTFRLLPPLSPELRVRRLLTLSLRDLRRIAITSLPQSKDWESRIYSRLAALPDQATPLQRAQLLATLSVGNGIISLRHMACPGPIAELNTALRDFAQGNSALVITQLRELEHRLASTPASELETAIALRARGSVLVICEALAQHCRFFDTGATA